MIIGITDERATVAIHHANLEQIAKAIANSDNLLASAHLGKAIKEVEQMQKKAELSDLLEEIGRHIRD